jgi:hypothetical protein
VCARRSLVCLVDESSIMLIACSTCSDPSGIFRSLGEQIREPERQRVLLSLVTRTTVVANPCPRAKPVITSEATSDCIWWTIRGYRERRAEQDRSGTWEIPSGGLMTQRLRRTDKAGIGPNGKSESLIVALKRVTIVERRGDAVDRRPMRQGVPLG